MKKNKKIAKLKAGNKQILSLLTVKQLGEAFISAYNTGGLANTEHLNYNGNTPLHLAIKRHAFYVAFVLIDDMKGIQLNIKNNDGKTPIDLAKGLIAYSGEDYV